MELLLISGLSGSGKSIALAVLEDSGYYCVDNLPALLLTELARHLRGEGYQRVAVAVDMRGGLGIAALPSQIRQLQQDDLQVRTIFLDARDDVLIQRFSETRRRHPLVDEKTTLVEAIKAEREALAQIAEQSHRIDTSDVRPNALRSFVKDFAAIGVEQKLTLLFVSFGFKYGLPLDADLVFDIRCLPNPHYDPALRPLTGRDAPVIKFLEAQESFRRMAADIHRFVADWLPDYVRDNRSYLTVAIGCTGGQHRSVCMAEKLAAEFAEQARVLVRHRSLAE